MSEQDAVHAKRAANSAKPVMSFPHAISFQLCPGTPWTYDKGHTLQNPDHGISAQAHGAIEDIRQGEQLAAVAHGLDHGSKKIKHSYQFDDRVTPHVYPAAYRLPANSSTLAMGQLKLWSPGNSTSGTPDAYHIYTKEAHTNHYQSSIEPSITCTVLENPNEYYAIEIKMSFFETEAKRKSGQGTDEILKLNYQNISNTVSWRKIKSDEVEHMHKVFPNIPIRILREVQDEHGLCLVSLDYNGLPQGDLSHGPLDPQDNNNTELREHLRTMLESSSTIRMVVASAYVPGAVQYFSSDLEDHRNTGEDGSTSTPSPLRHDVDARLEDPYDLPFPDMVDVTPLNDDLDRHTDFREVLHHGPARCVKDWLASRVSPWEHEVYHREIDGEEEYYGSDSIEEGLSNLHFEAQLSSWSLVRV
ncbi:hypothetical protein C1H76_2073 [Elsinoe australis]|uniref:Uncharacterized protein n=1 Tax=Elsinoe australis TaxID=40998 RepID=A0A4U7B6M2_9PEZI|nr:hypothetical protein C1H76_2073 [Elsinoe australis]